MELFERVRYLRKEKLQLTQSEFAEKLGVKRDVINNIENNRLKRPELQEPVYRLICKEFGVNEDWLRTGTGGDENIFVPENMKKYLNIGKSARNPNEFREFLSRLIELLPDEYCDYLYAEFKRFYEEHEKTE